MSYYAPESLPAHTLTTDADVTKARWLAAQLAVIFPDPAANAAVRLPAEAASSASRAGETLLDAPADGSAVRRGPALVGIS